MEVIKCSAGDCPSFVFTANNNWRLISDAEWCKFQTSGGAFQEISGSAGTHEVRLTISNYQIKDRVTYANITIIMGSNKAVLARIERDPDKFDLKVYDITGTPTNSVIYISYQDYTPMLIWANFDFVVAECPDWVDIGGDAVVGVAGEQTEARFRIVPDGHRERYPITKEDGFEIVYASNFLAHDIFLMAYHGFVPSKAFIVGYVVISLGPHFNLSCFVHILHGGNGKAVVLCRHQCVTGILEYYRFFLTRTENFKCCTVYVRCFLVISYLGTGQYPVKEITDSKVAKYILYYRSIGDGRHAHFYAL
jgi:hypothetical protein